MCLLVAGDFYCSIQEGRGGGRGETEVTREVTGLHPTGHSVHSSQEELHGVFLLHL